MLKSPSFPKEILSGNYQEFVIRLAFYLWNHWKDYLINKNISPEGLKVLLSHKYGKLIKQLPDKESWEKLVNSIKQDLLSDEIEYYFVFSIEPPSVFGLPENNITVIPADPNGKVESPSFHTWTGKMVGHGTLPRYRDLEHKLNFSGSMRGIRYSFDDNFLHLRFKTKSRKEAFALSTMVANNLAYLLTLISAKESNETPAIVFKHKLELAVDQYGRDISREATTFEMKVVWYNLNSLKHKIEWGLSHIEILDDPILKKSLQYFYYALFLNSRRGELRYTEFSNHMESMEKTVYKFLVSDIILNLYKSVSTIVGDPSKDKDYQKRYRKFGIDKSFWENNIEELRNLRNDWDVAHYSISDDKLQELTEKIGKAIRTAQTVIIKYIDWAVSQMNNQQ